MKIRRALSLAIGILQVFSSISFAEELAPISGQIHRPHFTSTQIILPSGKKLKVKSKNLSTRNNLLRLKEGDLLAGQGIANTASSSVDLHSIELVGLNDLIGFWATTGPSPTYLEFEDFQNLSIYGDDFFKTKKKTVVSHWFRYMVTPSLGNRWTVFILQGNREFSGNLVLHRNQLRLNIIEPQTGIVIYRLKLRRVRD